MLEFLELAGLAIDTFSKNIFSCEYNKDVSLPRKIFATKVPPSTITCVLMHRAANSN